MRIAASCALLVAGCAGLHTRKGNHCAKGDEVCRAVVDTLDQLRSPRADGDVRFGVMPTNFVIEREGRAALPYLENAFDDPWPEVAVYAMLTAIELGGEDRVIAWCEEASDRLRIMMCRKALGAD